MDMHSMMKLGNFKTLFLGNFQLVLTRVMELVDSLCNRES